jgi:hypothetical protein
MLIFIFTWYLRYVVCASVCLSTACCVYVEWFMAVEYYEERGVLRHNADGRLAFGRRYVCLYIE